MTKHSICLIHFSKTRLHILSCALVDSDKDRHSIWTDRQKSKWISYHTEMDFTYRWRITILYPTEFLAFYLLKMAFFFSAHWARSEKVEFTQEIGREDTGLQKVGRKNYTEMLKDRCCRLSVMNILLRVSPLELFNSIFLYKKEGM